MSFLFYTSPAEGQIDRAVFAAIKKCDLNALKKSIKPTININAVDSNGANALMWAVYYCDLPIVKYLVRQGAKVPDSAIIYLENEEMMHYYYGNVQGIAAARGKLGLLKYFADSLHLPLDEPGYNRLSKRKDESTPLLWALHRTIFNERKRMDIVPYLLEMNKEKLGDSAAYFIKTSTQWSELDLSKIDEKTERQFDKFLIDLARQYFGAEHIDFSRTLLYIGDKYYVDTRYADVPTYYGQGMPIWEKIRGEDRIYAMYVHDLAYSYYSVGQFSKAISWFEHGLNIIKKVQGEESLDYAMFLSSVSQTYWSMGHVEKAIPSAQKSVAIRKKVTGEENRDYAVSLSMLGFLYYRMGLYNEALALAEQFYAIMNKLYKNHVHYLSSLSNLATTYSNLGYYDKALPLLHRVITLDKKFLNEENQDYAIDLQLLGVVYSRKAQYSKAIPLLQKAAKIFVKSAGEESRHYASCLSSLGSVYQALGQYKKAIPLYQNVVRIYRNTLGETHPEYTSALSFLGNCYTAAGNSSAALPVLMKATTIDFNQIKQTYSTLTEEEKIKLLLSRESRFHSLPSLVFAHNIKQPQALIQLYQNELLLKGIVLQSQQDVINSIHNSEDSAVIHSYTQWKSNNQLIAKQLLLPLRERMSTLDSLQEITNQQEQALSRHSAAFRSQLESKTFTVQSISRRLAKEEVAIEFIRFKVLRDKNNDSILYAALLLFSNDSIPRLVPLFEEKQLMRLLHPSSGATAYTSLQTLYAGKQTKMGSAKSTLYELIWKPLEKYMQGITTVHYAPVGLMHRISFSAVQIDSSHTLIDRYHLHQLLSTRSIAAPTLLANKPLNASIWGNIEYNPGHSTASVSSARGLNEGDTALSTFNLYTSDTRSTRGSEWRPLPATKAEIEGIGGILRGAGVTVSSTSGLGATEETFKSYSGKSPRVLHLATHGFFLPLQENKSLSNGQSGERAFTIQQNPMFRSGLVLAGGNETWKGRSTVAGKEDGILTAFELAQMDLSSTNLVVLSACETALGDLSGTEGVIGLQRALKMAGVKQMILSLWQVPDKATMELMTQFYKNWLSGQPTYEALRNAQLQLKQKYHSPYFWAAFVLVE